jgi:hypothetical protein
MTPGQRPQVVVLIPVFNDWDCIFLLLPLLDEAVSRTGADVRILLVDDGSTRRLPSHLGQPEGHIRRVDVLHLNRNLGHQRAIAVGLFHVYRHIPCDQVIVMDADGQDLPDHIPALLDASRNHSEEVIFAARTKRLESLPFRIFYHLYRLAHRMLTGISVRVGNFSARPWSAIERLMSVSDLWSHYAAAVVRARLEYETVPLPRGQRLVGNSRMNFSALLIHGLSAICVFGDVVSARVLTAAVASSLVLLAGGASAAGLSAATSWTVPFWAVCSWAVVLFLCVQTILLAAFSSFTTIGSRSSTNFIPLRDAQFFIRGLTQLTPASQVRAQAPPRTVVRA